MGKKQHSKDRMHLTATEWKTEWGGHKDRTAAPFKRLPFHCCAISFLPFEDPVCTPDDGIIYDVINAVPYVLKYKRHPVKGTPLQLKDLVKLNFHKNADGEYDCPVMAKVFTEHTHIVAVRTTGNVYCYEAIEELCVKPKNWRDLLTDEPFTRKDLITVQDPLNLSARTIDNFDHVQKSLAVDVVPDEGAAGISGLRNVNEDLKRALGALATGEARAAFERGGGGKRAEAMRLLLEAKAGGGSGAASNGKADSKAAAAAGAAAGGAAPAAPPPAPNHGVVANANGGDWRLRAPARAELNPSFKPGASTWDTEDYRDPLALVGGGKAGKKAAVAAQAVAAAVTAEKASKMTPQQRYEAAGHVKWEVDEYHTTGAASRAFTSTSMDIASTKNARTTKRHFRNPNKKGYVRLSTTHGDVNLELHCDMAPRTCENFIALCEMGYYTGTIFHRSIRNFMIQGGDPTGTGLGGESIYGPKFKDEVDTRLTHSGRGILSMANSGPGTNGSQFFITYKSCNHLNLKHSVFGRVVGGFETLTAMEKVPVTADDRPTQEIRITGAVVFTNPYQEMEDAEKAAEVAEQQRKEKEDKSSTHPDNTVGKWFSNPSQLIKNPTTQPSGSSGVGKYIRSAASAAPSAIAVAGQETAGAATSSASAATATATTSSSVAGVVGGGSSVSGSGEAGGPRDGELGKAAGSMAPPPAKKPKLAASLANFDAW